MLLVTLWLWPLLDQNNPSISITALYDVSYSDEVPAS
jgi:hypothetical protein